MKKSLFIFLLVLSGMSLFAQDCSDLFISEYIEGTGQNKALEFYNPTDKIIDLSKYLVARYANGEFDYTAGGITRLQGFIKPYSTHVLVNPTKTEAGFGICDPVLQAMAQQLDHDYPAPTSLNGNDAIALFYDPVGAGNAKDFVVVDLFGIIGGGMTEPDEGWTSFTDEWVYRNIKENGVVVGRDSAFIKHYIAPENYFWLPWSQRHSLVRKPGVKKGVTVENIPTTEFVVTMEWDTVPGGIDKWDSLGAHYCDCEHATELDLTKSYDQISIYPNPVSRNFFIRASVPFYEVILVDASGKAIYTQRFQDGKLEQMIDPGEPNAGIYLLKIRTEEGFITKKIVIT